ncbi:MAG: hypothetical protein M5U28_51745 [Sandaracinaceae bacterium]|nr:hypothetical protein [Sandaracinaceae bacterium]
MRRSPRPRSCRSEPQKDALDGWIGETCAGMPFDARRAKRRSIAEQLSLDEVERRCRAFELFRKDLRAALAP